MPYDERELAQLVAETRRPYLTPATVATDTLTPGVQLVSREGRDVRWDKWRDVRHRRANPWLPRQAAAAFGSPLYYRDTRAGKAIDEITQRLGVNAVHVAVSVEGDAGPKRGREAEKYEAWLRGAMHSMDQRDLADKGVREHQSADGIGVFELEQLQGYVPPPRQGMSDKDYDTARAKAAKDCGFPLRLSAPDPRSLYWPAGQETPSLVVKVVNKPLIDVQDKWLAEGFRLGYAPGDNGGRIVQQDYILGGELPPMAVLDVGRYVRCVVVATGDMVYHCVYREALTGPTGIVADDSAGTLPNLMLLASYRNLLGHPPFYICPARTTSDIDPAYHYLPLAYELLELTPELNAARSLRKITAYREGLKPAHAKPMMDPGQPDPMTDGPNKVTPPGRGEDLITPGIIEYFGEFRDIPTPSMQHLEKWDQDLVAEMNRVDSSIRAALKAGDMGKTTPAWAMQQYKEEENGFLKEALDSRASAWREILIDATTLCRIKYAKDQPVYVSTSSANKKKPEAGSMDTKIGMSAADLPNEGFIVNVSIDALTQSQRAADTEYWRRLGPKSVGGDGTLSRETYETNVGIEDRFAEDARKERDRMEEMGQPFVDNVSLELAKAQLRAVFGEIGELVLGPAPNATQQAQQPGMEQAAPSSPPPPAPPATPEPELPGEQPPVMPGMGMGLELPVPPSVSNNGTIPVPVG